MYALVVARIILRLSEGLITRNERPAAHHTEYRLLDCGTTAPTATIVCDNHVHDLPQQLSFGGRIKQGCCQGDLGQMPKTRPKRCNSRTRTPQPRRHTRRGKGSASRCKMLRRRLTRGSTNSRSVTHPGSCILFPGFLSRVCNCEQRHSSIGGTLNF